MCLPVSRDVGGDGSWGEGHYSDPSACPLPWEGGPAGGLGCQLQNILRRVTGVQSLGAWNLGGTDPRCHRLASVCSPGTTEA